MIRNYLKIAFRSITRNKLTAFINIAGLALAMSTALLIYLFITDELSYDSYHSKADRVYRVTREFLNDDGAVEGYFSAIAPAFGPALQNAFGEVEAMTRTLSLLDFDMTVEENGERTKTAHEENVLLAEPDVLRIFDIPVVSGNPDKALVRPFTVMLSEKTAHKYFSSTDVVGKRLQAVATMNLGTTDKYDLEVTGVYEDFPAQSHWHPDFLIAFSTLNDSTIYGRDQLGSFGDNAFHTYILMIEGADPKKLEAAMPAFVDNHLGTYARTHWGASADWVASRGNRLHLQPLTDIHLHSHLDDEIEVNGNINNVYMMGVIGLFIVLIACFNFINLSTARATKRAREVGMRKVAGALKSQLVGQFLSESVLIALFAFVLAITLATVALPWMNSFAGKSIDIDIIQQWPVFVRMVAFACIVGILAGVYPAFVISAYRPAVVLRGQQGLTKGKGGMRRVLVVVQFAISIVLLIATAVTTQQLGYLNTRDIGYDKNQIITLRGYPELESTYDAFYNEVTNSVAIRNIARSSRLPTGRLLDWLGSVSITKGNDLVDTGIAPKSLAVDYEFFDTYGIPLVAGRSFSKAIASDQSDDSPAFVINETAALRIGWKTLDEGIGKDFKYGDRKGKLIGIVKDFNFESLHQEILPMVFHLGDKSNRNLSVNIDGTHFQQGIADLETKWKAFFPQRPFTYQVLSDRYNRLYDDDQKQSQLFTLFSAMAIFIACLGLFGLATFNTLQRVKEIGIRKVLGASVPSLLALLSKEVIGLVLVASLMAWPVAWYLMSKWLNSFAYRIEMSILTYTLAAIAAVALALLTVSLQTVKAALTNPSNSLRYE